MESIDQFVARLQQCGLPTEIGPMSSRIEGDSSSLFRALGEAFDAVAAHGEVVLTAKISNACPRNTQATQRRTNDC